MHAPITVNYVPDGKDWTVTVTDDDQTRSATASGLIAARDQADQIVEKMVPEQTSRTVVHLLEGDAVAFTNTYLQARLGLTPTDPEPPRDSQPTPANAQPAPEPSSTNSQPTPEPSPANSQPTAAAPTPSQSGATPQTDTPTPTDAAETPGPESPAPLPSTPDAPESPSPTAGNSPELANVPAQGANQPS